MFDLKKAMEMKKQMDEMQAKLDNMVTEGSSGDGKYTVTVAVTASKKVKNIDISEALVVSADKEHLEDLLLIALERAMEKAQSLAESEARNSALGGGLSGLFGA
ncbi:MAG: YbaB/EbfC family nucleoid-associated protein [Chitinophagales bacterium]